MTLRLLPINKIQTLGLDLAVDKRADKASNDFLGPGMVVNLTYRQKKMVLELGSSLGYGEPGWTTVASLVLLVGLHGLVGGSTADQFVGPLRLVRAVGHLVVVTVLVGIV